MYQKVFFSFFSDWSHIRNNARGPVRTCKPRSCRYKKHTRPGASETRQKYGPKKLSHGVRLDVPKSATKGSPNTYQKDGRPTHSRPTLKLMRLRASSRFHAGTPLGAQYPTTHTTDTDTNHLAQDHHTWISRELRSFSIFFFFD